MRVVAEISGLKSWNYYIAPVEPEAIRRAI